MRRAPAGKATAAPNTREALKQKKRNRERRNRILWYAAVAILCIVLPPAGLICLWSGSSYDGLARLGFTVVAIAIMTVFIGGRLPNEIPVSTVRPVMMTPEGAKGETDTDVMQSLTDMNILLASTQTTQQQTEEADPVIASAQSMQREAEKQNLLNQMVYTTHGRGTRYYHSVEQCGTQKNTRQLTLAEALAGHLGACPDCDPPIYNILSTEKVIQE